MSWSGSKPLDGKWYRIRDDEVGRKQMLEASHQWAIEMGLDDNFKETFNHYVKVDGDWLVKRNVAYRYLFADLNVNLERAHDFERPTQPETLDRLFETLRPIQEWVVYLEERLNDCELAIQYLLSDIAGLRSGLKSDRTQRDGDAVEKPRQTRTKIEQCVRELLPLQAEHEALVTRLFKEEGRRWHGMACCREISGLTQEALLARFLDEAD